MILAVDVYYYNEEATAGAVAFADWSSSQEDEVYVSHISSVEDYVPGEFYRRELPCIMQLMTEHRLSPDIIIIDGLVYLDGFHKPGLGKYLFDALGARIPVVGVAKSRFLSASDEIRVFRGRSNTPLYVTSAGIPLAKAKTCIMSMHGKFRIPSMLKKADRISKQYAGNLFPLTEQ